MTVAARLGHLGRFLLRPPSPKTLREVLLRGLAAATVSVLAVLINWLATNSLDWSLARRAFAVGLLPHLLVDAWRVWRPPPPAPSRDPQALPGPPPYERPPPSRVL